MYLILESELYHKYISEKDDIDSELDSLDSELSDPNTADNTEPKDEEIPDETGDEELPDEELPDETDTTGDEELPDETGGEEVPVEGTEEETSPKEKLQAIQKFILYNKLRELQYKLEDNNTLAAYKNTDEIVKFNKFLSYVVMFFDIFDYKDAIKLTNKIIDEFKKIK